jgi:hypothetical protein
VRAHARSVPPDLRAREILTSFPKSLRPPSPPNGGANSPLCQGCARRSNRLRVDADDS